MQRTLGWLACAGAVVLLIVAMVMGLTPAAATAAPRVTDVWVRLAAVPGRPAAGYFLLSAGVRPVELVAVASPLARIELHGMSMAGDVMRMDTLPSVRVAARARTSFAPGQSHLMLFGVPASVKPGATMPLTFRFADRTLIKVDAAVRAAGADAPMAMPMPHGAH
jgi:copper(I)-binding protein